MLLLCGPLNIFIVLLRYLKKVHSFIRDQTRSRRTCRVHKPSFWTDSHNSFKRLSPCPALLSLISFPSSTRWSKPNRSSKRENLRLSIASISPSSSPPLAFNSFHLISARSCSSRNRRNSLNFRSDILFWAFFHIMLNFFIRKGFSSSPLSLPKQPWKTTKITNNHDKTANDAILQTAKKARHVSLLTRTFKVARDARVTRVATRPQGHVGT